MTEVKRYGGCVDDDLAAGAAAHKQKRNEKQTASLGPQEAGLPLGEAVVVVLGHLFGELQVLLLALPPFLTSEEGGIVFRERKRMSELGILLFIDAQ